MRRHPGVKPHRAAFSTGLPVPAPRPSQRNAGTNTERQRHQDEAARPASRTPSAACRSPLAQSISAARNGARKRLPKGQPRPLPSGSDHYRCAFPHRIFRLARMPRGPDGPHGATPCRRSPHERKNLSQSSHSVGRVRPPQGRRGPTIFSDGSSAALLLRHQWPPKKIVTPTAAARSPASRRSLTRPHPPDAPSPCHSRQTGA